MDKNSGQHTSEIRGYAWNKCPTGQTLQNLPYDIDQGIFKGKKLKCLAKRKNKNL